MIEVINQSRDGGQECLRIDANETIQVMFEHPRLPAGLCSTLEGSVSWQKRNEIKAGAGLRSMPVYAGALIAWGAAVVAEKEEPLADFMERGSAIGKLTAILIPLDVPGRSWGESHVCRTPTDTPIVSAFVVVDLSAGVVERARLALTGVWEESVRLARCSDSLLNKPLDKAAIEGVAEALAGEVSPKSNYLGSGDYRRTMAQVTARRALGICLHGGKPA